MLGKAATVGITAFWVIMMTQLVRQEILPAYQTAREEERTPRYARLLALARQNYTAQMGITMKTIKGEKRIGFTKASFRELPEEGAVEMNNTTRLTIDLPMGMLMPGGGGGGLDVKLNFRAKVGETGLLSFRLDAFSEGAETPLAIVDGLPVGDKLRVKIRHGGETRDQIFPFNAESILSNEMGPMVLPGKLEVGETWPVRSLDPTTYSVTETKATVRGKEKITIEGEEIEAYVIAIPYGTTELKVWADRNGEVLMQRFFAFTFVRETPSESEVPEQPNDRN